jgi:predicted permease
MNSYVGFAGAFALLGPQGLTLSAVAVMGMIPITNFICVPVVAHFGDNGRSGLRRNLWELARNPLILACLTGFCLNLLPVLPHSLLDVLALLGRVSLPLGLMAVGAALEFTGARAHLRGVVLAAAAKLLLLPRWWPASASCSG